VKRTRAAAMFS